MDLKEHTKAYERIQRAIKDYQQGKMVIMVDDEDRENEGDVTIAAEKVTPEHINFMAKHARGLICLSLTQEQVQKLELPLMVNKNDSPYQTGFTVSIEASHGVTTGISAADRAKTVHAAIGPNAKPNSVVSPGHVFPIRAKKGGVMVRAGHTEGTVDLARLAGLNSSGVMCEIMNDDGTMARMPDLEIFAKKHDMHLVTIEDIIKYRMRYESLIQEVAQADLPTHFGKFRIKVFENDVDDHQHIALQMGKVDDGKPVLVRVHSECLTGDIFASARCDCGAQLHAAMKQVGEVGRGVILYVRQEGRGIGLVNKIKAYHLQDHGRDTVEANIDLGFEPDLRDYGIGAQVLAHLGVKEIELLTNNPKKIIGLEGYGLHIVGRQQIEVEPCQHNQPYLFTKKEKMGHLLKKV